MLDTVVETAARLCDTDLAAIAIREGEVYRYVSMSTSAAEPEYWAKLRQRTTVPGRDSVAGRVALEGRVVHVEDIRADPDYALPEVVADGRRTGLGVPLLRDSEPIGIITLRRAWVSGVSFSVLGGRFVFFPGRGCLPDLVQPNRFRARCRR